VLSPSSSRRSPSSLGVRAPRASSDIPRAFARAAFHAVAVTVVARARAIAGELARRAADGESRRALASIASVLALFVLTGCGGGGLHLTPVKSTANKPSNVAVYFKVETSSGEPVGGLGAEQFKIYEDGSLVSTNESKQTILNPEVAASHYTLLLVDMSGSVSADAEAVSTLVDAASAFTERVEKSQKVAVYAFDGGEDLHPIAPFESPNGAHASVQSLKGYKPQDPSTNLNGAIVRGLAELDKALTHAEHPMKFGTLVVFSDGTDRASRVPKDQMRKAVKDSSYQIFAIGLGSELQESELKDIGKDGTAKAQDKSAVVSAFDDIAKKIEGATKAYYLLSYCSPSRAGKHEVKVEASYKEADGKTQRTGTLKSEFDAAGFTHGCDPNTPPNFDVTKGDALAPKDDDKKDDKAQDKKPKTAAPGPAKPRGSGSVQLPPPPPPPKSEEFTP